MIPLLALFFQPSAGATGGGYGAPAVSYGAPEPSYGAPEPAYGAPGHSYSRSVSYKNFLCVQTVEGLALNTSNSMHIEKCNDLCNSTSYSKSLGQRCSGAIVH